jgi:hypothetical protein
MRLWEGSELSVGEPPNAEPVFSSPPAPAFSRCAVWLDEGMMHSAIEHLDLVQRLDAVSAGTSVFVEKTRVRVKHGQPRTLANGRLQPRLVFCAT